MLSEFDPWRSGLCTCPKKYSFCPYTGCSFNCLYCYASSYVPRFHEVREKKDVLRRLSRELDRLPEGSTISMANSSDPYPKIERELRLTRNSLEILSRYKLKLLIVTKSDLVVRDIDILKDMRCAVAITITGVETNAKIEKIEPSAPPPMERIEALRELNAAGIPTICRIDPIIPFINDSYEDLEDLVSKISFVDHIITSTYKVRGDDFKRICAAFPEYAGRWRELFEEGDNIQNSRYLPKRLRFEILGMVKKMCEKYDISFATCREGFELQAKSCDGSHLIK